MSYYSCFPPPLEQKTIRVLRLLPNEDDEARIQCEYSKVLGTTHDVPACMMRYCMSRATRSRFFRLLCMGAAAVSR
jgi:hypothetical protein